MFAMIAAKSAIGVALKQLSITIVQSAPWYLYAMIAMKKLKNLTVKNKRRILNEEELSIFYFFALLSVPVFLWQPG
jgi:hypothetical protein